MDLNFIKHKVEDFTRGFNDWFNSQPPTPKPQPTNHNVSFRNFMANQQPSQSASMRQDLSSEFTQGFNNFMSSIGDSANRGQSALVGALKGIGKGFLDSPVLKTPTANPYSPSWGQVGNFAKSALLEAPAQVGMRTILSLAGDKNFTPDELLEKFIYGNQPVKNWQGHFADINSGLKDLGVNSQTSSKIAPALGIAGGLLDITPFGIGKKQLAEGAAKQAAKVKLGGLINYADDLLKMGYKPQQIDKISYNDYLSILKNSDLLSKEKINGFKNIFNAWVGQRDAARTIGSEYGSQLKNIPLNKGMEIINYLENPTSKVASEIKTFASAVKNQFDDLFLQANRGGIDVQYLKNYISHIWQESPEQIEQAFQRAGTTFKFSLHRKMPSYSEGLKMGLQPAYSHPAEIVESYTTKLFQVKANIELLDSLKRAGFITDAAQPGFTPIVAPGIKDGLFAPTQIASRINRIFSPEDNGLMGKALDYGRRGSSTIQDITLSGGVPSTALNAFSFAQLTKEVLAGRIQSPVMAMVKSLNGNSSLKFFEDNIEQIKKLQLRNIPINSTFNVSNMIDKGVLKNVFGEKISEAWSKAVNEPTFGRLMPMLQINLFNDIEKSLIKAGKEPQLAADIAAKAVSNFYGVTNSGTQAMRSKIGQDAIGTFFFAPKYRESMINFWINNVKSLRSPLAPENKTNFKFLIGSILTYLGMDQINRAANGHGMQENPQGSKDKLLIPLGDGTTLGIPFLSSIATMPRAFYGMADSLAHGNLPETVNQGKTFLSSAIRPLLDLATNENYFGQEIYKPGSKDQLQDMGAYALGQYNHPYIRAAMEKVQGKLPDYQIALKALELPLRFYKTKSLSGQDYYANKEKLEKGFTPEQKKVTDYLTLSDSKGGSDSKQRASILIEEPWALDYYRKLQLQSDPNNPLYSKDESFIKGYLAYQLSDDTTIKASLRVAFPEIPTVQRQLAEKFSANTGTQINPATPLQQLSPEQVKIASAYTASPKGSLQRKQLLAQNPWLLNYWEANEQYYKENPYQDTSPLGKLLADLGINQTSESTSYSPYQRKSYSSKVRTAMRPKVTFSSTKVRMPKLKKFKVPKFKTKMPKIKQSKITFKPLKGYRTGGVTYG